MADPEAGLAARFLLSCSVTPFLLAISSGLIEHSKSRFIEPAFVTIKSTSQSASESASTSLTAYCAPEAPVTATTALCMKWRNNPII